MSQMRTPHLVTTSALVSEARLDLANYPSWKSKVFCTDTTTLFLRHSYSFLQRRLNSAPAIYPCSTNHSPCFNPAPRVVNTNTPSSRQSYTYPVVPSNFRPLPESCHNHCSDWTCYTTDCSPSHLVPRASLQELGICQA